MMTENLRRFYIAKEDIHAHHACIKDKTAHHIMHVLRLDAGDRLIVFCGDSLEHICKIESCRKHEVHLLIEDSRKVQERDFHVSLMQALPKLPKMDIIIEKATELAVDAFYPVITQRTTEQKGHSLKRHERWRHIAISASEQSRRYDVPVIHPVQTWTKFLTKLNEFDHVLICTPDPRFQSRLNEIEACFLNIQKGAKICVLIGPEGDFTQEEVTEALNLGALPMRLGSMILRTETAAIVALGLVQFKLMKRAAIVQS
ncbi:MAG: RsmE family RNA methyltransferase [Chlamydiota bacterium]|nr:RsmE family RNA methyltransferase [Chlamydiota bacterium]